MIIKKTIRFLPDGTELALLDLENAVLKPSYPEACDYAEAAKRSHTSVMREIHLIYAIPTLSMHLTMCKKYEDQNDEKKDKITTESRDK